MVPRFRRLFPLKSRWGWRTRFNILQGLAPEERVYHTRQYLILLESTTSTTSCRQARMNTVRVLPTPLLHFYQYTAIYILTSPFTFAVSDVALAEAIPFKATG